MPRPRYDRRGPPPWKKRGRRPDDREGGRRDRPRRAWREPPGGRPPGDDRGSRSGRERPRRGPYDDRPKREDRPWREARHPREGPPRADDRPRGKNERPWRQARPPRDLLPDDRARREHAPNAPRTSPRPQVEGRRAVMEALRAGVEVRRLRFAPPPEPSKTFDAILEEARARRVTLESASSDALDAQSTTGRHQGVIAEVVLPPPLDLGDLLSRTEAAGAVPFFVVLDAVEDPQNLGAIARSAEAAGANGLILPERNSAHVSPGSLRASAGAILLLPVAVVKNTARCLEALKAKGIWIAGADPKGEKPYHQASLGGPIAFVIGGESKGLHRLVRDRCDFLVKVPLLGRVESLNASAAAAVLLFEVARQRAASQKASEEHTKTPK